MSEDAREVKRIAIMPNGQQVLVLESDFYIYTCLGQWRLTAEDRGAPSWPLSMHNGCGVYGYFDRIVYTNGDGMVAALYGAAYGPASVVRLHHDDKHGAWLVIGGEREQVEVRVTRGGRLRVGPVVKAQNELLKVSP